MLPMCYLIWLHFFPGSTRPNEFGGSFAGDDLNTMSLREPNGVAGGIAAPGSHTTGHAGPRPAVPGSPDGQSSHSFSATMIAAQGSAPTALCLHIEAHWPGASESDRWAIDSTH